MTVNPRPALEQRASRLCEPRRYVQISLVLVVVLTGFGWEGLLGHHSMDAARKPESFRESKVMASTDGNAVSICASVCPMRVADMPCLGRCVLQQVACGQYTTAAHERMGQLRVLVQQDRGTIGQLVIQLAAEAAARQGLEGQVQSLQQGVASLQAKVEAMARGVAWEGLTARAHGMHAANVFMHVVLLSGRDVAVTEVFVPNVWLCSTSSDIAMRSLEEF